jgi:hypothetical protein
MIKDKISRKTVLVLLLLSGLFSVALALAVASGGLMLDPFPPSAPPM